MEQTECAGAVAASGLRYDMQGRDCAEVRTGEERQEPSAGEARRLKPIYTPLDGGSLVAIALFKLIKGVPGLLEGIGLDGMEWASRA
jgi:hypothetical protein